MIHKQVSNIMPPKRKAAEANNLVGNRSKTRKRLPATTNRNLSGEDGAVADAEGVPVLSMTPSHMQNLIKQAYERGLQEARAQAGSTTIGDSSVATEIVVDSGTTSVSGLQSAPCHPEPVISDEIGGSSSTMFLPNSQTIPANCVVRSCEGVEVSSSSTGNDQFHSASIPLMDLVSDKVKERIWANKFVDLASITDKNQSSFEMVLKGDDDESPSLHWCKKEPSKKKLSRETWKNKFTIFTAVYCKKYPDAIEQLLKYSSVIRDLALKQADWVYYDTMFRDLRCHREMAWDLIHMELWHEAISRRQQSSHTSSQASLQSKLPNTGKGPCWKFMRGVHCGGCKYSHKCGTCGARHAAKDCPMLGSIFHNSDSSAMPFAPNSFRGFRAGGRPTGRYQSGRGRYQSFRGNRGSYPRHSVAR
ncbi:uncharacterized protein LOC110443562 [Mizuhopecten yessoensis]|uniref:uncharacterized protein LOC110443562 n=1 Tax=Mizuhopecten yessoensis TaxID=6573 RepID=UPI000B45CEF6|nr:uncharacterized protein LOC110443562 [Mizuhopecten yessoensis]